MSISTTSTSVCPTSTKESKLSPVPSELLVRLQHRLSCFVGALYFHHLLPKDGQKMTIFESLLHFKHKYFFVAININGDDPVMESLCLATGVESAAKWASLVGAFPGSIGGFIVVPFNNKIIYGPGGEEKRRLMGEVLWEMIVNCVASSTQDHVRTFFPVTSVMCVRSDPGSCSSSPGPTKVSVIASTHPIGFKPSPHLPEKLQSDILLNFMTYIIQESMINSGIAEHKRLRQPGTMIIEDKIALHLRAVVKFQQQSSYSDKIQQQALAENIDYIKSAVTSLEKKNKNNNNQVEDELRVRLDVSGEKVHDLSSQLQDVLLTFSKYKKASVDERLSCQKEFAQELMVLRQTIKPLKKTSKEAKKAKAALEDAKIDLARANSALTKAAREARRKQAADQVKIATLEKRVSDHAESDSKRTQSKLKALNDKTTLENKMLEKRVRQLQDRLQQSSVALAASTTSTAKSQPHTVPRSLHTKTLEVNTVLTSQILTLQDSLTRLKDRLYNESNELVTQVKDLQNRLQTTKADLMVSEGRRETVTDKMFELNHTLEVAIRTSVNTEAHVRRLQAELKTVGVSVKIKIKGLERECQDLRECMEVQRFAVTKELRTKAQAALEAAFDLSVCVCV
jgi:hypothetical protein